MRLKCAVRRINYEKGRRKRGKNKQFRVASGAILGGKSDMGGVDGESKIKKARECLNDLFLFFS